MTRPLNFSFPSRRQFLIGSATTTLSAAAVALLAGRPTLAAAKGVSAKRPQKASVVKAISLGSSGDTLGMRVHSNWSPIGVPKRSVSSAAS